MILSFPCRHGPIPQENFFESCPKFSFRIA
jgi:hypothetical protein